MAENKHAGAFDVIMKNLKAGRYAPVYILMGDEPYFIEKITDYIAENVLKKEERDFNQRVIHGRETTDSAVVDEARAYPVMAERRLVIVKECQMLNGDGTRLAKYLAQPVNTTVLVLCFKDSKVDMRSKMMKTLSENVVVFESKKKKDYEIPGFIQGYLKTQHATIEEKAAQMIADFVGTDLQRLTTELQKVLISLPESAKHITPEIVEHVVGVSKEFNGYELRDALAHKQVFKANQIIDYFDKNSKGSGLFILLPTLYSYFQNLMIAYYTPGEKTDYNVAQYLELKTAWAAKPYTAGMRNYSGKKVMEILSKIEETDMKNKGVNNANTSSADLMKELVFFILH